jgi:hypothetical protein
MAKFSRTREFPTDGRSGSQISLIELVVLFWILIGIDSKTGGCSTFYALLALLCLLPVGNKYCLGSVGASVAANLSKIISVR